jgi:putative selenium metabolism protein SsnA
MIIHNGKIVTWEKPNQILTGYGIAIKEGVIAAIAPQAELIATYPEESLLDAHSQFIMPGNICAHTHFYGAYARGLAIPGPAPDAFPAILKKLWWPLDKALTLEDIYYSTLVCLIDAVKHGTTSLIDHNASPNAIQGSLDTIAAAVSKMGVRAALCYEVTDRDGEQKAHDGIRENGEFFQAVKTGKYPRGKIGALFGLHASLTLTDSTLDLCRESIEPDAGIHIHVAEHQVDEYDSIEKSGLRVVERLDKHGLLNRHSILAHAVHIDMREMEIIAAKNCWVTHQPRSNMNNAVGLPRVEEMLRLGIKVGLGNDGFSNAMWEEWKSAYLAHKLIHNDPRRMNGLDIIEMAIYQNSNLVTEIFDMGVIGKLIPGALADIIFVEYHPYTSLTADNLPWHMIFGFHESMITTTIVDGIVLMKDRKLLWIDEEEITQKALAHAPGVWQRYQELIRQKRDNQ